MTMEKFMLWLATAATLLVAVPTLAAQDDPRLRELFDKLAVTDDDREGELIQAAIWTLWLNSGDPRTDALMMRGIQAIDARDLQTAEQIFTEMVEKKPKFAEGWNKRATVRYLAHDYEGSLADIGKTLALEPRHFGALSGLGMVNMALGRDEAALEAFKRAFALYPNLPGAQEQMREIEERIKGRRI
jgi:tetratricopeptide (TPR) repeat protein